MSPAQTIATIVACAVVAVVGIVATLVKVLKPATRPFNGETREILAVLREIRDRLVGQAYEQSKLHDCAVRIEQSQQALHLRFDKVVGVRDE